MNRSISLEGEKYVLLASPGLDTVYATSRFTRNADIFAKIFPGTVQNDTHICNA